jgi:uncharacterized membrane protein
MARCSTKTGVAVVAIGMLALLGGVAGAGGNGGAKPKADPGHFYAVQPLLPLAMSFAYDVNDSGQAIGGEPARVWESPEALDRNLLSPAGSPEAEAINNSGQIVGHYYTISGDFSAPLLWECVGGQWLWWELPSSRRGAWATDINGYGQIVGHDDDGVLLWQPEDGYAVPTVIPGTSGCGNPVINDAGQIACSGIWLLDWCPLITPEDTDCDGRPDLWFRDDDGDGTNDLQVALPALPGGTYCEVSGINSLGQVVGTSGDEAGWAHAVVWEVDEWG